MCHFEDVEYFGTGSDDAELTTADLHVAVDDHEGAEAGAVDEVDGGEIEDQLVEALVRDLCDLRFDFAQAHAESHASG